jgi:hypothetical protein
MLFVRMVILPFFVALALVLAVSFLSGFLGFPIWHLSSLEWAALLIPTALMTSGYFGVKTIVQELARVHAALRPSPAPEDVRQEAGVPEAT